MQSGIKGSGIGRQGRDTVVRMQDGLGRKIGENRVGIWSRKDDMQGKKGSGNITKGKVTECNSRREVVIERKRFRGADREGGRGGE